jgi:hypothetical protein
VGEVEKTKVQALTVEALTVDELLRRVRRRAKEIYPTPIIYALRKMRAGKAQRRQVEVLRHAVALAELGLPITVHLIANLCNISYSSTLSVLHALGDKHVLVLKRKDYKGGPFEWLLSPVFLRYFEEAYGKAYGRRAPRPSPEPSGGGRRVVAPAFSSLEEQALVVR